MSSILAYTKETLRSAQHHLPTLATPSQIARNIQKIALPTIALAAAICLPSAEGGLLSGVVTAGLCFGAGLYNPASLFWAAAPCYEAAMWATVHPLLP
jgi:hypothetical protein